MHVPLLDLTLQHRDIAGEIAAAMAPVVAEQRFILGPVVDQFERAMEEGGTHAELMARGGLCRRLFDMQFGAETETARA